MFEAAMPVLYKSSPSRVARWRSGALQHGPTVKLAGSSGATDDGTHVSPNAQRSEVHASFPTGGIMWLLTGLSCLLHPVLIAKLRVHFPASHRERHPSSFVLPNLLTPAFLPRSRTPGAPRRWR